MEAHFNLGYPQSEGNVCICLPFYRTSIFKTIQVMDGLPIVSNLQLYLDLMSYPVTGRDQAEWLREKLEERGTPIIGKTSLGRRKK